MNNFINKSETELTKPQELAYRVERELLKMPQAEHETFHDFVDGVYARTFTVGANVLLTGAMHRHASFFVVRSGLFLVTTDEGDKIVGPGHMIATKPDTKRILFTLRPVVITTFHANPTNETDPEKLWDMFTVPEPENFDRLLEKSEEMGRIDLLDKMEQIEQIEKMDQSDTLEALT